MRSSRPTFRRPEPPSLDQFVDQLESKLRHAMEVDPPTMPSRLQQRWDRWARWMLRPVMHGGMALVAIFLVAVSVSTPTTRVVMDVSLRGLTEPKNAAYWVDVIEVPDPVPVNYPTVPREQMSRFVVLVEPAPPAPYVPDAIGFISV
jgi:hypothetical protein